MVGVEVQEAAGRIEGRVRRTPWPSFRDRSISVALREIRREQLAEDVEQPFFVLACSTEAETAKCMYGG